MRNELVICGLVESHEALRYTPAGVACFVGTLTHDTNPQKDVKSNQQFTISIIAFDQIALDLINLALPQQLLIKGKLIKKHAHSKEPMIQISQFKLNDGV